MIEKKTEETVTGFNKRVTYRDESTGQVVRQDPYTLRIVSLNGGGKGRYFERPAGSGNLFDGQGNPVGRWDRTKPENHRFIAGAEHIAWERPQTEDEKLAARVVATEAKNKALEAELAAMKAEAAKKAGGVTEKKPKES